MTQINELVLYFGLDDESQETLMQNLLTRLAIEGKKIEVQDVNRLVGELAGSPSGNAKQAKTAYPETPKESIIVMKGLADARINELLAGIRQTAGLRIAIKAVVTDQNSGWPFSVLAAELRQEHAMMNIYNALQQSVRQAELLMEGNTTGESLKNALQRANKALTRARQQGEIDPEQMAALNREIAVFLAPGQD